MRITTPRHSYSWVKLNMSGKGKSQEGLWEFPGGKIELEETPEECLERELREELDIEIKPYAYFGENDYWYGESHIQLIAYRARFVSGEIKLVDHDEYCWVNPSQLGEFAFAPADCLYTDLSTSPRQGLESNLIPLVDVSNRSEFFFCALIVYPALFEKMLMSLYSSSDNCKYKEIDSGNDMYKIQGFCLVLHMIRRWRQDDKTYNYSSLGGYPCYDVNRSCTYSFPESQECA